MYDCDDFFFPLIVGGVIGIFLGMVIGASGTQPTDLPNGCILYEDAIYCEVTE